MISFLYLFIDAVQLTFPYQVSKSCIIFNYTKYSHMGSYFQKQPETPFQYFFNGKKLRAVILGLDAAGKTTLLYKLNIGEVNITSTIAFNIDTVQFQKVNLTAIDIGGHERMMRIYQHFYKGVNAVIFVVDSTDEERMEIVFQQLHSILASQLLKGVPLLVLANKQDLGGLNAQQISERLKLSTIKDREWTIQPTCAKQGDGLQQGFQWLLKITSKEK